MSSSVVSPLWMFALLVSGTAGFALCSSKNYKWEIHLSWFCKPHSSQATEKGCLLLPLSLLYFTKKFFSPSRKMIVSHLHPPCVRMLSHSGVSDFATPWTVTRQAPLPTGVSRQQHWSGLPCPPSGDLPNPEIEPEHPTSPALQTDSLLMSLQGTPSSTAPCKLCESSVDPSVR